MRLWRTVKDHLVPHYGNAHRPHILRRQWLVAFLGIALLSEAVVVGNAMFVGGGPNVFLAAVVRSDVIAYTDEERTGQGVAGLHESDTLDAAAQAKADDMAARGYFSHVDPDGHEPWAWFVRGGYDYIYAGENLAVRFNESRDVVNAWMASPTHRANIVKPQYQEIGVGVADGTYKGSPATFVVQFFASPSLMQQTAKVAQQAAAQPQGQVQGVETGPAQETAAPVATPPAPAPHQTPTQSIMRMLGNIFGNPRTTATWALVTVALILGVILALTFFIRIQVQPADLLIPGLAVAMVAVLFLGLNAKYLPAMGQQASVLTSQGEVDQGIATQRVNVVAPAEPAI